MAWLAPKTFQYLKKAKKSKNYKRRVHRKERKVEKNAKYALESGQVVILVKENIPPGAISVLGKGLGYVSTPALDVQESRLDMRLVENAIINRSKSNLSSGNGYLNEKSNMPYKLVQKSYAVPTPSIDQAVNEIVGKNDQCFRQKTNEKTSP